MTLNRVRAYIGIGANLSNPIQQVTQAIDALTSLEQTTLVGRSSWYQSRAVGPGIQPDYINGVAAIDTQLCAIALLDALQSIELQQKRVRHTRWGPRTLDLDLLLFGDDIIQTSRLTVPHPRIRERNFVVIPLAQINPDLVLPEQRIDNVFIKPMHIQELAQDLGTLNLTKSSVK